MSFHKYPLLAALLFFLSTSPSHARDVILAWDIHPDTNVSRYEVHYDTDSGAPYTGVDAEDSQGNPLQSPITVDGRDNNSITLYNLNDTDSYYFAVTASFGAGSSSDYSREVCALGISSIEDGYDKGWSIISGDLKGFKVFYGDPPNPPSNDVPTLGASSDIPPINLSGVTSVGVRLNLLPLPSPTVPDFNPPVKIIIPCPGYSDVSGLDIYHYDGSNWALADDTWMVAGSRENYNNGNPSTIAIWVYRFSGVQAGTSSSSSSDSGGGAGGGCFIASAAE